MVIFTEYILISCSSGCWEVQGLEGTAFLLCHLIAALERQVWRREGQGKLIYPVARGPTPTAPWLNHLLKVSPPGSIALGFDFPAYELKGTHESLSCLTAILIIVETMSASRIQEAFSIHIHLVYAVNHSHGLGLAPWHW